MSMTVLGLAYELKKHKIGVNALWPVTAIATAAVKNVLGGDALIQASRYPSIMADAADIIFKRDSSQCTGNFYTDEQVLKEEGITDFSSYAVNPEKELAPDFFL